MRVQMTCVWKSLRSSKKAVGSEWVNLTERAEDKEAVDHCGYLGFYPE